MLAFEIILLIIAYTLMIIAVFLEVICYKRNIESLETIALTISLLLLIVSLTISPVLDKTSIIETTNVFTLVAMILVGLTTPLNVLTERKHSVPPLGKNLLIAISIGLLLLTVVGYFTNNLVSIQYVVIVFLALSVISSMILVGLTKPQKKVLHLEKTERIFALAFLVIVPLSLFANYAFVDKDYHLKVGFTLPLLFILLSGRKIWDDLQRLSLLRSTIEPKEQHFKNYALTKREQEIALVLIKGSSYKQIAEELHISLPTVKTHASNIYKKCGVRSRSELTMLLINP